jgi:lysozyme family protein
VRSDLFQRLAVPWILDAEGGYVDDAADRGGATRHGISLNFLRSLPDHDGDGFLDGDLDRDGDVDVDDIRRMDTARAIDLYHQYFWAPDRCDELAPAVALCLFDGLVNHAPRTARMLVQRGLRVLVDGDIGPKTRAAAAQANPGAFLADYCSWRAMCYADLVDRDPTQARFRRGWFRRLFLLQHYTLEMTR